MATQQDFVCPSDSDKVPERISSSLDPSKKPQYKYHWCVMFNWDCNEPCPFFMHKLSMFNSMEIKQEWITGNLGVNSRVFQLRNLSPFPGGVYSLFAKVEMGKLELLIVILKLLH